MEPEQRQKTAIKESIIASINIAIIVTCNPDPQYRQTIAIVDTLLQAQGTTLDSGVVYDIDTWDVASILISGDLLIECPRINT
jgi:hypothetical protein